MEAASQSLPSKSESTLALARSVIRQEADVLHQLADRLGRDFEEMVAAIDACAGSIVVTGMGKAGLIGQKISSTFCSTGTRSFFLHPAEAIHGDLGRVANTDLVLALSMSGETEELLRVLPAIDQIGADLVAITSTRTSTLGRASRLVVELGGILEACALGLAPSTSTTAMLALGDAIALTLSQQRQFSPADFARYHPGGSLGRKLTKVQDAMRGLGECRIARVDQSVRETFITLRGPKRRTGAVMIVDDHGCLVGVFTDSDLARLLEKQSDTALDQSVGKVMTSNPHFIRADAFMSVAMQILATHHISELPVLSEDRKPIGLIDITDIIGWQPEVSAIEDTTTATILRFPAPKDKS